VFQPSSPRPAAGFAPVDYNSTSEARQADFQFELLPLHSQLLGESLLVSFPPLNNMLKFSGSSYLISGLMLWMYQGFVGRAHMRARPRHTGRLQGLSASEALPKQPLGAGCGFRRTTTPGSFVYVRELVCSHHTFVRFPQGRVPTGALQETSRRPDSHIPTADLTVPWRGATDTETSMLPESFRKRHVRSKIR
jgi:hypothetical protein